MKNVWPAPFARVLRLGLIRLRQRMRPRRQAPSQDGEPRISGLIKLTASKHHFYVDKGRDCHLGN